MATAIAEGGGALSRMFTKLATNSVVHVGMVVASVVGAAFIGVDVLGAVHHMAAEGLAPILPTPT